MLHNYSSLYGLQVHGTDRNIGTLWDILFDDRTGKINYFVINISTWFFGKHVLVVPEKCSIDDGNCQVAMSSGEFRKSPDESIDPPVYMQEQDKVYSAFLVSLGLVSRAGGFPLFSTTTGDKAEKTAQLRSVREVVSYSVNEPDSERACGHASDAAIRDREWFVDHFVVNVMSTDGTEHATTIPFENINKISYQDAAIMLSAPLSEIAVQPV